MLSEEGFSCFKTFWTAVNKKHSKLFQPTEGMSHYLMCDFDLEVSEDMIRKTMLFTFHADGYMRIETEELERDKALLEHYWISITRITSPTFSFVLSFTSLSAYLNAVEPF